MRPDAPFTAPNLTARVAGSQAPAYGTGYVAFYVAFAGWPDRLCRSGAQSTRRLTVRDPCLLNDRMPSAMLTSRSTASKIRRRFLPKTSHTSGGPERFFRGGAAVSSNLQNRSSNRKPHRDSVHPDCTTIRATRVQI